MFEKFICEEAKNGNCRSECSHGEPHNFMNGFCNEDEICCSKDKRVKCVEISMENYVR